MRHCVIENPGRFGPVSFRPGHFSLGLLRTSGQWQHLSLLSDIGLQKVTPDRTFGSIRPILAVSRFVLGRSFRPKIRFDRNL